jgi:hypothetical protein
MAVQMYSTRGKGGAGCERGMKVDSFKMLVDPARWRGVLNARRFVLPYACIGAGSGVRT